MLKVLMESIVFYDNNFFRLFCFLLISFRFSRLIGFGLYKFVSSAFFVSFDKRNFF